MKESMAEIVSERLCVHHWIIKIPNGSNSFGHCRNCHATRFFKNSIWDIAKDEMARYLSPRSHRYLPKRPVDLVTSADISLSEDI